MNEEGPHNDTYKSAQSKKQSMVIKEFLINLQFAEDIKVCGLQRRAALLRSSWNAKIWPSSKFTDIFKFNKTFFQEYPYDWEKDSTKPDQDGGTNVVTEYGAVSDYHGQSKMQSAVCINQEQQKSCVKSDPLYK